MYRHLSLLDQIYPNWDFWYENIRSGNPTEKRSNEWCRGVGRFFISQKIDFFGGKIFQKKEVKNWNVTRKDFSVFVEEINLFLNFAIFESIAMLTILRFKISFL
jgi:hypothetical protein